jgi:hypothetical protein
MYRSVINLMYLLTIISASYATCAAQESWLLQTSDGAWKKFNKESPWQKAVKEIHPLETAVVNRTTRNIRVVHDLQGESGDWRNVDRYVFQVNGSLISLERTFVSVSQGIKLSQVFELDGSRKLRKKLDRGISLATGKATTEVPDKPEIPIATNIDQLDFMKVD